MNLVRTVSETIVGENKTRYRTRVEIDGPPQPSFHFMLQQLDFNPSLLHCGYHLPQKMSFVRDESRWVIEAEATVDNE